MRRSTSTPSARADRNSERGTRGRRPRGCPLEKIPDDIRRTAACRMGLSRRQHRRTGRALHSCAWSILQIVNHYRSVIIRYGSEMANRIDACPWVRASSATDDSADPLRALCPSHPTSRLARRRDLSRQRVVGGSCPRVALRCAVTPLSNEAGSFFRTPIPSTTNARLRGLALRRRWRQPGADKCSHARKMDRNEAGTREAGNTPRVASGCMALSRTGRAERADFRRPSADTRTPSLLRPRACGRKGRERLGAHAVRPPLASATQHQRDG